MSRDFQSELFEIGSGEPDTMGEDELKMDWSTDSTGKDGGDDVISADVFNELFPGEPVVQTTSTQEDNISLQGSIRKVLDKYNEDPSSENMFEPTLNVPGHGKVTKEDIENIAKPDIAVNDNVVEEPKDVLGLDACDISTLIGEEPEHEDNAEPVEHKDTNADTSSKAKGFVAKLASKLVSTDSDPIKQKTQTIKNFVLVGVISFIVIAFSVNLIGGVFSKDTKQTDKSTQTSSTDLNTSSGSLGNTNKGVRYVNDTFNVSTQYVEDKLIVNKSGAVEGDSIRFALTGETMQTKLNVEIPVTVETYNSIEAYSILKVRFKVVDISGKLYATEFELLEVIN